MLISSQRRVRVAGTPEPFDAERNSFLLVLTSGKRIRCTTDDPGPRLANPFPCGNVVLSGVACFSAAGSLLFVAVETLEPATNNDLELWYECPKPLFATRAAQTSTMVQLSASAFHKVIGAWPGEESDDEIFSYLEMIS